MSRSRLRHQRMLINDSETEQDNLGKPQKATPSVRNPDALHKQRIPAASEQRHKNSPNELTAQDVLRLQSTIGNQKTSRFLAAQRTLGSGREARQPASAAHRQKGLVQRAVVLPNVGTFDTKIYRPYDRQYDLLGSQNPVDWTDRQVGAKILIEFTPNAQFETGNGNVISLVQTVRETIAKTVNVNLPGGQGQESVDILRENQTAGFPLRTVTDGTGDAGWSIDQQLFTDVKDQQGLPMMPPGQGQQAGVANYAAARVSALQALATFPNELALVQTTPDPLQMNPPPYGPVRPRNNFKAIHKTALQRVISHLRANPVPAAQQAVEAVRRMLQAEYSTRNTITVSNLDPRYAEQRTQGNDPRKARPQGNMTTLRNPTGDPNLPQDPGGGDLLQGHTFNAECNGNAWTTAALSDEPTVPFKTQDVLSGGMEFEVAALLEKPNGEKRYIGSVSWGWQINNNQVVLVPQALTLTDSKNASGAFFKASQAWNTMSVPDSQTGATLAPVSTLPTAIAEYTRQRDSLKAALSGRDRKVTRDAHDALVDIWGKLAPAEKLKHRREIVPLLYRYQLLIYNKQIPDWQLIKNYGL